VALATKQASRQERTHRDVLCIHLLGNPQVFYGEQPIPLPTPDKVLALWAYLLLNRQQPISREYLAYALWPDVPESKARANLRRHLHLLRQQLPAPPAHLPWILATRHTVQWNPDADLWLDVACLEAFEAGTADEARWAEVVACYRGDLLEGFYEDWVLAERERLHQRYIGLCEQRIDQQRSAGDLQGAIATTRRLLAHEPLREEPYRYLMEFYYRLGDRAAALREFERCEAMLRAELETGPMPETLALRDAILEGEAWTPLPAPAGRPAHRRPGRPLPPEQPIAAVSLAARPAISLPPPRRWRRWLAVGALLGLLAVGALLAATMLSPPQAVTISISGPATVHDTWLNSVRPDLAYDPEWSQDPYAAYPQVHLSYWGYPYDRVLIRFDLDQLPPRIEVQQAVFHLYLETFLNEDLTEARPASVSAFRMLVPWQQDVATFNSPWSQPGLAAGVDYEAQALGSDPLDGTDWVPLDVTDAVRYWLDHPDENWGLVVMITEAPQGAHYWLDTSDYPLADRQPHLDITYLP
jgi:DNA-binding SARP family transcriptional activator